MVRGIFRKIGWVIMSILKGIVYTILFVLKTVLGFLKIFLLLLGLVSRIFLIFVKAGIPQ